MLRVLAIIAAIVTITAAVGAAWQHVASDRGRSATPPPGEMIDVGGRNLHLLVSWRRHGSHDRARGSHVGVLGPVGWVQADLAAQHTVVAYDRPGLGWSTLTRAVWIPTASPRTCTRPLHRRGLQEPWVLVGHSIGGLLVRTFADRYADEVAGVVLVDATHPEVVEGPMMPIGGHAIRLLGRIGVLRATGLLAREAAGLPADKLAEVMPILNSSRHIEGAAGEMAGLSQIGRDTSAAGDLGSAPLTVITAGDQPQEWHALQRDLATLSSSSRHIVVLDAAHQSLATDHRHARIVADEVAQLSRS